jgi:hypothetical protein
LKRLPYEGLDFQPSKEGIDSVFAVGAGKDYFEIGAPVLGFFEDFPTGHTRQSYIQ